MPQAGRLLSAGLLVLVVSLRAAALLYPHPLNIDEARYLVAAHHLRTGVGYSDWRGPEIDIHPLHPALVATLGSSIESLEDRGRAVTFACSLLLLWPLGVLAMRLGGPKVMVLSVLFAAGNPRLILASTSVQPESLYVLLTAVAMVALWPGLAGSIPAWRWALAGALYGLAYLARPEGLLVGFLACGLVLLGSDDPRRAKLLRFGAFAAALLAFASPYLLFLRSATGEWTVTGKTAELFFVGQSLHDGRGNPPDVSVYLALLDRWKGVMPFIAANPGKVAMRVADNAMQIGVRGLPLGLGPVGLAGLMACAAVLLPQRGQRLRLAFVAAPALTLVLMLLTFRNDRVIASVLPFLLVAAAAGLVAAAGRLDLLRGRRLTWICVGLAGTVLCGWLPLAVRAARSDIPDVSLDRRAVKVALERAGSGGFLASNNPALSFHAFDPLLFGPPGRYSPLPWLESCGTLAAALHDRGARIALLDGGFESRVPGLDSNECPLSEAAAFEDRAGDRRISILAWR